MPDTDDTHRTNSAPARLSSCTWDIVVTASEKHNQRFGVPIQIVAPDGKVDDPAINAQIGNHPAICHRRIAAMGEATRLNKVTLFFLTPGILSWIAPILDSNGILLSGLLVGEIIPECVELDRQLAEHDLGLQTRSTRTTIAAYVDSLPLFRQNLILESVEFLNSMITRTEQPFIHNPDTANRFQSAEPTCNRTEIDNSGYNLPPEMILLPLIRTGDRKGAIHILNAMFGHTLLNREHFNDSRAESLANITKLIQQTIHNNPAMDTLFDHYHKWARLITRSRSPVDLKESIDIVLDRFIDLIFIQGCNVTNSTAIMALDYIASHYTEKIRLNDVARYTGLSRFRIAHLIKEKTGHSVFDHVKKMRIEKAKQMLSCGSDGCRDIARKLGFPDHSGFIKQFRELTGTTPVKYRKKSLAAIRSD